MINMLLDAMANAGHYWSVAMAALDGAVMTIAMTLLGAILAAIGGMVNGRARLYGAIVGGMLVNIAVKAMDGGFAAALVAMVAVTIAAYALGSTPFLLGLMKQGRLRKP